MILGSLMSMAFQLFMRFLPYLVAYWLWEWSRQWGFSAGASMPWNEVLHTLAPGVFVALGFALPALLRPALLGLVISGVVDGAGEWSRLSAGMAQGAGFGDALAAADYWQVLASLVAVGGPVALLLPAGSRAWVGLKLRSVLGLADRFSLAGTGTYGTARWMPAGEQRRRFGAGGFIVGEMLPDAVTAFLAGSAGQVRPLLRSAERAPRLIVGPPGAGKSTGIAVPNLLDHTGPAIVLDPKGELAAITGPRRVAMGRQVMVLDTSSPATAGFNVLGGIDATAESAVEDVSAVATWLSRQRAPQGIGGDGEFFDKQARLLVEVLLLDMVFDPVIPPDAKTLFAVYERMASPDIEDQVERISGRPVSYGYGAPGRRAAVLLNLLQKSDRTFSNILSSAQNMLAWLDAPGLRRLVCGHDFTLADIQAGAVDIFLRIPIKTLDSTPEVGRVIVGAIVQALIDDRRGTGPDTLLLLDELPRLGYMKTVMSVLGAGRGPGLLLWAMAQSLGQLEEAYGKPGLRTWLSACSLQHFIGVTDNETAEYVSRACGEITVAPGSRNSSTSMGSLRGGSVSDGSGSGEGKRRLITPDEVRRLTTDATGLPLEQIVIVKGAPALRAGVPHYFRRADLAAVAAPNPYHQPQPAQVTP